MGFEMRNKGQITIFIIIGLVIVASVIIFFVVRGGIGPSDTAIVEENPRMFLQSCIEDDVMEAVNIMLPQGGFLEPKLYKLYEGDNVGYICYTQANYYNCVTQVPLYLTHLEDELSTHLERTVQRCFSEAKSSLEEGGYDVTSRYEGFDLQLSPKKIIINVDGELSFTKSGSSSSVTNMKLIVPSYLYDLGIIAQEISSQETKFCYFEYAGYMTYHPDYRIEKIQLGEDSSKIYSIKSRKSEEELKIAIRSCALPGGY